MMAAEDERLCEAMVEGGNSAGGNLCVLNSELR